MSDFAELLEELLPEGWSLDDPEMGMESLLVCPCSHAIELDGDCPNGCISPLKALGLI